MSDRVKYGEVKIKYCPTNGIIGDYFTKPLKGSKFRKPKGKIVDIQISDNGPVPTSGSIPQEYVEDLVYKQVESKIKMASINELSHNFRVF